MSQSKLQKRQYRDGWTRTKRIKLETTNVTTTKITEVNDDCLEHIFNKLELVDLLNVADTCKHFRQSVDWVFERKYKSMKLYLTNINTKYTHELEIRVQSIWVFDILTALKLLRNFGHLLITLDISGFICGWMLQKIFHYINKYCVDTLTEIHFYCLQYFAMEVPLPKVETVTFSYCTLSGHIIEFNKWFPQLRNLEFRGDHFAENGDGKCIEKTLSNLDHLSLKFGPTAFQASNIGEALRLNPQIRRLQVANNNLNISISKYLQNINDLDVHWSTKGVDAETPVIHLKNVQCFRITCYDLMPKILYTFDCLKKFTMESTPRDWNDVIDFVNQNQTLIEVTLKQFGRIPVVDANGKFKLAQTLAKIKTVNFYIFSLSVDEAITFTTANKALKSIRFKLNSKSDYDDLKIKLSNEWTQSIGQTGIVQLKR
ncbi:uncharacterized protein LOC116347200 [Contarinia nasturtii]|uniref:uncharacterized protein LOC116347200 n=1 Tax=Contarinia nasturtii TaxID=265458 RepID=UPI0012D40BBC|nr:uncharacterized protein LOC116347200 [Contarinia nasturtii]